MRYAFEWLLSVVVLAVIGAFILAAMEAGSAVADQVRDYGLASSIYGGR